MLAFTIYMVIPPTAVMHLDGTREVLEGAEKTRVGLTAFFVTLPLLAGLAGALAASFPPRGLPYRLRFVRRWLACLAVIYGASALTGTLKMLRIYSGL